MVRCTLAAMLLTAGAAQALTPENRSCEMPGVGLAAFVQGFDSRYALFDWWDKSGDELGNQAVIYADCQGGKLLRSSTLASSDALAGATEILWTAGHAGQGGDLAALTKSLEAAGFTVDQQDLPQGHCACADAMIAP
ncbi:MAG: hypothetical protein EAZ40_03690 [Rhodobacterales bacterium]|nr:MAG: hypothetical protein EAZ40_03690 [Rhodobacterales bacterium]